MTCPDPPISVEQGLLGAMTHRQSRRFDHITSPARSEWLPRQLDCLVDHGADEYDDLAERGTSESGLGVPYRSPHTSPSRGTRRVMEGAKECLNSEDGG